MANKFLNGIDTTSLSVNSQYSLPTSDGSNGQVLKTDGSGNVTFSDGADSGFVFYTVKNSTGSTIAKGTGVYASGTDGNSGHILISPMVVDGTIEPKYFIGITKTAITNGSTGQVVHFGEIDQINTSTYTDGDVLWCDPSNDGGFTTTEPTGPNLKLAVAIVINASTNGKIRVRVQGNEGLHELHDVNISSQANGDLLQWNATSGVWENKTLASIADSRYVNVSGDTMTGSLNITTGNDNKINLRTPSGDNSDWNYINFYGRDGQRDAYVGIDGDGDLNLYSDKNSNGIFITSTGVSTSSSITADSFVKDGGTSTDFLKADGSIDSNSYALSSIDFQDVVTNGSVVTSGIAVNGVLYGSYGSTDTDITALIGGSTFGGLIQGVSTGHMVIGLRENGGTDSFSIISGGGNWTSNDTYDKLLAQFRADGIISLGGNTTVSGNITANSLIKSGGTSSQFLKADGSVDSNSYALSSHNHDDRYYTESEIQTFFNRGYIENVSASNLAVGWYTIATNTGDRALGEFQIWDIAGSDHQSVLFNASHHYGNNNSNDITVLANSRFSGTNFRYIRIKELGTYDGAALQVYIDGNTNAVYAAIVGGNAQYNGWVLKDWIPDATDPGDLDNWSSFTTECQVDLDNILNGGIITTGEIYSGGATTQYRVFHDNYHPNADKWTSSRTITLGGNLSGSVSLDGSGDVTLTGQVTGGNIWTFTTERSAINIDTAGSANYWSYLHGTSTTDGTHAGNYQYVVSFGDKSNGIQFSHGYGNSADSLFFRAGTDNNSSENGANTYTNWRRIATREWVNAQNYLTSLPSHSHQQLSGFANQTEYDVITSGNLNGLRMKARWDSSTSDRYWDIGYIDGFGTFYSGLKVVNGGDLTYKGNTVIDSGSIGSQSVDNADKLDGIHATGFFRDLGDTGTVTDFDNLLVGINHSNETTATNQPFANHNITLTFDNDASAGRMAQIYMNDTAAGGIWFRPKQGTSGWHDWSRLWGSYDFTSTDVTNWGTAYSYSQVGHLPLSGGTLTGQIDFHRNDNQNIIISGNSSATGIPDQFYIKHDSGNVNIGNLRGDIKFTDGRVFLHTDLYFDGTPTTTTQNRGIFWTAFDKEATTDFTDSAHIRHLTNTGGLAGSVLEIKSHNDSNDGINFNTNGNDNNVKINGNTVIHLGNLGQIDGRYVNASGDTMSGSLNISSSSYVQVKVDQTDSASITMGVSSGGPEGFINVQTDEASHVDQSPVLKFIYNDQGAGISEYARFTTAGLGLGTANPKANLHIQAGGSYNNTDTNNRLFIESSGHSYLLYSSPDEYDSGIHFHNTTDNSFVGRIAYTHRSAGDQMLFRVGGSERVKISTTGYVLDVTGNTRTSGNLVAGNIYSTSGTFVFGSSTGEGEYFYRSGDEIRVYSGGSIRSTFYGSGLKDVPELLFSQTFNGNAARPHRRYYLGGTSDYAHYVVKLCRLSNLSASEESTAIGRMYAWRGNGLYRPLVTEVHFQRRYNSTNYWATLSGDDRFQECTFTHDGEQWAGVRFHPSDAMTYGGVWFEGMIAGTHDLEMIAYYTDNGSSVLNSEINNSLSFPTSKGQDFVRNSNLTARHGEDPFVRAQYLADNDWIQIEANSSGGLLKAVANGSTTIMLRSYGDSYFTNDVAINITQADSFLHVGGAGNSAGGNILMGNQNVNTNKWSYLCGTQYAGSNEPEGIALIGAFSSSTENRVVIGGDIFEANPSTSIEFWTHNAVTHAQGGTRRMVINNAGDVSIGNTYAGPEKFNVSGNIHTTESYISDVSGTHGIFRWDDNYHGMTMRGYPNSQTGLTMTAADVISFWEYGGDFRFYQKNPSTFSLQCQILNGTVRAGGDVVAYYSFSDERLKENVEKIDSRSALDQVLNLQGVTFTWKDGQRQGEKQIGFIAQEVEKVVPEVVREQERIDDQTFKTVDYENMVALLTEAIKEQQKQIDELKAMINGSA